MKPLAVYVHIPFCPTKCGYCDFNSYAMDGDIVGRTAAAIERQIRQSPHAGRPAKTVFFGGGTPTFLAPHDLGALLRAVLDVHPPEGDIEITSEANPGTVDAAKFEAMREAGFNRISLGAQSFQDEELLALGRVHRSSEIARAVGAARGAGFDNLNLDLMFALPGQSARVWRENLERAIGLAPDHLSLYCLTLEPNTAFYKRHLRGDLVLPEDSVQAELFLLSIQLANEAGYAQYEISNFARLGKQCEHNLCYWRGEEYAAYGPGAVGRVGMHRATSLKHPERYCEAVEAGAPLEVEAEVLDEPTLRTERIMLGLRLNEGLEEAGLNLDEAALEGLERRGWAVRRNGRVSLTVEGMRFCNDATVALL